MHLDDSIHLLGPKAQIYFVENIGMAWGWELGGNWGKMILTLFRLAAVIFGVFYIKKLIREQYNHAFIVCAALIFAGALGNLIDSMFYGMIFDESTPGHIAQLFPAHGYAGFLHGKVVDMFYFPLIRTPKFEFFADIFNIADASISTGVICILLFQRKLFRKPTAPQDANTTPLIID
jgi:signal peptidase II